MKKKKYSNDEELFRIIVINLLIVFSIMFLSLLYNKKADDVILTPSSVTYETNTYVQYIERSENNTKQNLPIAGITEIMYGYMQTRVYQKILR